jgi:LmbE family N-acetylglucosaminyl deacetylase
VNDEERTPLRVIIIAAHPDEADMYAGGTAALFAKRGHQVKFVSLTCGDAGHDQLGRYELAARRFQEAQEAARRLGVREYAVFDAHDGELMPSLETRQRALGAIRAWQADIVIGLHPDGGGHPDNRAAGVAVQEAMAFVTNRNALPGVPPLTTTPLYLYMIDYITMRVHRHDLVVDIDETIEDKLRACDAHASQFYEYSARKYCDPADVPASWPARRDFILTHWADTMYALPAMRASLASWYGADGANEVTFAETFQFAADARRPNRDELLTLFPMLPEVPTGARE